VLDFSDCGAPEPCEPVSERHGEINIPPDDAALRCVIQAFHDRTPGLYIQTSTIAGADGSESTTTWVYLIRPDGSVARQQKLEDSVFNPQLCAMRPPSDYEACLASVPTGSSATAECSSLTWATDCSPGTISCG
jgi:hypothetical protein